MTGNNLQSIIQRVTETPRKHQVEHFVHLPGQHRSNGSREHSQALEDRSGIWSVLLPILSA